MCSVNAKRQLLQYFGYAEETKQHGKFQLYILIFSTDFFVPSCSQLYYHVELIWHLKHMTPGNCFREYQKKKKKKVDEKCLKRTKPILTSVRDSEILRIAKMLHSLP